MLLRSDFKSVRTMRKKKRRGRWDRQVAKGKSFHDQQNVACRLSLTFHHFFFFFFYFWNPDTYKYIKDRYLFRIPEIIKKNKKEVNRNLISFIFLYYDRTRSQMNCVTRNWSIIINRKIKEQELINFFFFHSPAQNQMNCKRNWAGENEMKKEIKLASNLSVSA